MSGAAAPLDEVLAEGPDGGVAHWLRTSDGLRLRVAFWPGGPGGTVLIFPGRTEFIEKYGRSAAALAECGFASACIDWRGQGLADRLAPDAALGHVDSFAAYRHDVAALRTWLTELGAPHPWFLLGHSMGGAIGLRALHDGLPVARAAFTGPMWGIRITPVLRPLAWLLACASWPFGFSRAYTPGSGRENYAIANGFEGNTLTSDRGMYDYMVRQMRAHPEMTIGGPSFGWLSAALCEICRLARLPAPPRPVLTWLGADEQIVDKTAVARMMARWPGARLEEVPGARHEVLMETAAIRARLIGETARFFAAAGAQSAVADASTSSAAP